MAAARLDFEKIQKLLLLHQNHTASLRADLAQRTAGEVLHDDAVLENLRRGKTFNEALLAANAAFPSEALDPSDAYDDDAEGHYRLLLRVTTIDEEFEALRECERKLADCDKAIVDVLEQAIQPLPAPTQNLGKSV